MTDMQTADSVVLPASALDRMITRAGRALVTWSAHRELRRAQRLAARMDVLKSSAGILDPDAPRAVRSFGFPPGIFR
jgi:hypothetical protein